PLDRILDPRGQCSKVPLFGPENHIATHYVGLRVTQSKRFIQRTQRFHFDLVVAANIDATEHGDDHSHKRHQYIRLRIGMSPARFWSCGDGRPREPALSEVEGSSRSKAPQRFWRDQLTLFALSKLGSLLFSTGTPPPPVFAQNLENIGVTAGSNAPTWERRHSWSGTWKLRPRPSQIVKDRSLPIDNECTNRLSNWKDGVDEKKIAERRLELPNALVRLPARPCAGCAFLPDRTGASHTRGGCVRT